MPPNVRFLVDDVEEPWADPVPYDFIQCRYMAGAIKDWPGLIKQVFDHLKPGGWAQFGDYDTSCKSQDNTIPKNYKVAEMLNLLTGACDKIGRKLGIGPNLKGWVEEAGFANVGHKILPLPVGIWPKDKTLVRAPSSLHLFSSLVVVDWESQSYRKILILGNVEGSGCLHDAAVYGRCGSLHSASFYGDSRMEQRRGGCVEWAS